MPLYEYHCKGCDKEYEILHQTFAEAEQPQNCGDCQIPLERKLSTFTPVTSKKSKAVSIPIPGGGVFVGEKHCEHPAKVHLGPVTIETTLELYVGRTYRQSELN